MNGWEFLHAHNEGLACLFILAIGSFLAHSGLKYGQWFWEEREKREREKRERREK